MILEQADVADVSRRVELALFYDAKLANFGKEGRPEPIVGKFSQEMLAEMIGTSRSRVSNFMNKFRDLGFISYNGSIEVHSSLLSVVLHDQPKIKTSDEAIDAEEGMLAHALSSAASRGGGNPGRPVTCGLPAWGKQLTIKITSEICFMRAAWQDMSLSEHRAPWER